MVKSQVNKKGTARGRPRKWGPRTPFPLRIPKAMDKELTSLSLKESMSKDSLIIEFMASFLLVHDKDLENQRIKHQSLWDDFFADPDNLPKLIDAAEKVKNKQEPFQTIKKFKTNLDCQDKKYIELVNKKFDELKGLIIHVQKQENIIPRMDNNGNNTQSVQKSKEKKRRGHPKEYGKMVRITPLIPDLLRQRVRELSDKEKLTQGELFRLIMVIGILNKEGFEEKHNENKYQIFMNNKNLPNAKDLITKAFFEEDEKHKKALHIKINVLTGKQ